MSGPLVSVIVPFLDEERFLQQAIDSVAAQTYRNWELLLVDDGSTDESSAIARAASDRDPARIRYIEHEGHTNRGTSVSRNLGLRHSRGELIAYLDGDDLWLPYKLERQVPLLLAHPDVGALYGTTLFWFFDYNNQGDLVHDFVQNLGVQPGTVLPPPRALALIVESEHAHPTTCSTLLRRSACEAAGGWDDRFRDMYDDSAFLARLLLTENVLVTGECACVYRLHLGSTCHQAQKAGTYNSQGPSAWRGIFLHWLASHLHERGVIDRDLAAAVKEQLRPYDRPIIHRIMQYRLWRRRGRAQTSVQQDRALPPPVASTALLDLAACLRTLNQPTEAAGVERKALRVLRQRRSRTYTLMKGELEYPLQYRLDRGGAKVEVSLLGTLPVGPPLRTIGGRFHLFARGFDAAGRAVAFAFPGDCAEVDGSPVKITSSAVTKSLNAQLLRAGWAYPVFDPSIPDYIRRALAEAVVEARLAGAGLWRSDVGNPLTFFDGDDVEGATMWPKLRRHLTTFFAHGERQLGCFPAWLANRGLDEPVLLATGELVPLSTLIETSDAGIRLRLWPEEIIGLPETV